jgi:hypothetical protein
MKPGGKQSAHILQIPQINEENLLFVALPCSDAVFTKLYKTLGFEVIITVTIEETACNTL